MQNVPKIVRVRLQAATPAVDHPDADVLTAFTERSLAEDERAVVLEHLARCGDCRDIVALALPATEPVETAVRPHARGWLTWPVLRWGFVTAGVVAIASVGIVQYQRRPQNMASKSPARLEVAANEAKDRSSAPPVSSAPARETDKRQARPDSAFTDSVGAPDATLNEKKSTVGAGASGTPVVPPPVSAGRGASPAVGGSLAHGPKLAQNQWQQQNSAQNQAPAPAPSSPFAKQQAADELSAKMRVPAVSETVSVETQSAQLDTQIQNLNAPQIDSRQIKDQPAAPQPLSEDHTSARVGKAKPAETMQTADGAAPVSMTATPTPSQAIGGPVLASSALVPRWTINSTGGLQRSFDQGSTWQDVDVNANASSFMSATSLEVSAKTSRAKVKDGGQALKREAATLTFRAVAATGPDVWAGGSGAALYHSLDAGSHWTRVVPASSGRVLTGDIVSLEFPDMRHGKTSTSTGETWITSDDGQTWQKQ